VNPQKQNWEGYSLEPVHVDDKFFVREGNRKRELSVKEGHDYIVRHWER
jgi:hypothetical protein